MLRKLTEYARKRDFRKTPEPPAERTGAASARSGGRAAFFIQRHDATSLHYDFRLAIDGTLKSWAVPKGPSMDPAVKRLAMEVEDHPLSYGTFEGNIPKGEYGGGSVMLWDRGEFELLGEKTADEQLQKGDLKFVLHGTKVSGEFALVRMHRAQKKNEWLLIKKKDAAADAAWDVDTLATSVVSGLTQEEIASGGKRTPMPASVKPMLATLMETAPEGLDWAYEIKWDGVRALCYITDGEARFISRNGLSYGKQFPELKDLPSHIKAEEAILDGEIVATGADGRVSFQALQPRLMGKGHRKPSKDEPAPTISLFLFDVLYCDGVDLRERPLNERTAKLKSIVKPSPRVQISEQLAGAGAAVMEAAREHGLEGIIAKRLSSRYHSARSSDWVKVKVQDRQEFAICGWLSGKRQHFSALVLGLRDDEGFRWCGNVGTGFSDATLAALAAEMGPLRVAKKPAEYHGPWAAGATWIRPKLVAEIRFTEWTREGRLRAPVFLGLRTDKRPQEAAKETPVAPKQPTENARTIVIDGRSLALTNLNKVYFPEDKLTKGDIIDYYAQIAPVLEPYLKDRPTSLRRYPNGIHGESFFQKNLAESTPDWVASETIYSEDTKRDIRYALVQDAATLVYLANLGCIDQNPWVSRVGSLDSADYVLIDLDPNHCVYDRVIEAAQYIGEALRSLGLKPFVKTSGGNGIHVVVPLKAGHSYDDVRAFTGALAMIAARQRPDLFTIERAIAKRKSDRVYFDYVQIGKGKTIAAPYVVRPVRGAAVSTPLEWDELKAGMQPTDFHIGNIFERLDAQGDLWKPTLTRGQRLAPALRKVEKLLNAGG